MRSTGQARGDVHGRDAALAQRAAAGEREPRREIAGRLLDRVRSTACYLSGHHADLDDLTQLALMEILRSCHTFRGESSLETWADRIAVRTMMREIRSRRRDESRARPGAAMGLAADTGASPDDDLGRRELQLQMIDKLQRLSPEQRSTLVMRFVLGHSIAEIATMTRTPHNTVRDRLQVGKRKLREMIEKDPNIETPGVGAARERGSR